MEKLKWMKEVLEECVEKELACIEEANTEELGEAIDMIKDLEEAMYYHTIRKSMKHSSELILEEPITAKHSYMKVKSSHQDKAIQMRELEKYMQEITADLVEIAEEATPEEKAYLSKRITTLASKISQLTE